MSSKTFDGVKLSGILWRTNSPSGHFTALMQKLSLYILFLMGSSYLGFFGEQIRPAVIIPLSVYIFLLMTMRLPCLFGLIVCVLVCSSWLLSMCNAAQRSQPLKICIASESLNIFGLRHFSILKQVLLNTFFGFSFLKHCCVKRVFNVL